jgi:hypothetical protein
MHLAFYTWAMQHNAQMQYYELVCIIWSISFSFHFCAFQFMSTVAVKRYTCESFMQPPCCCFTEKKMNRFFIFFEYLILYII